MFSLILNSIKKINNKKYLPLISLIIIQNNLLTHAASTDIADVPMAVSNMVTPNVLVVYDNSQSMDAFMNGTLVSGSNPNTRGNIGRSVMRNAIDKYRKTFNWGLMSYELSDSPKLYNTYAQYMGSNTGMVFTNDCSGYVAPSGLEPAKPGTSATNGNRRCIANPEPFFGANFITFDRTGDDADIQDVLYTTAIYSQLWGISPGAGTSINAYRNHFYINSFLNTSFYNFLGTFSFTPTDAGFLAENPPITRQLFVPRGWGYMSGITGKGELEQKVDQDSDAHFNILQSKLANETNGATTEIKNGAVFTPLQGTLESARTYFSSSLSGNSTPVQYSCQQNFVMLVTDGLPTGNTSGALYSATDRTNSCSWSTTTNSCTSGSFGNAATSAITASRNLRQTSVNGVSSTMKDGTGNVTGKFDVQTYVVALGDTVANGNALSVMNAMAFNGGTEKAILATDATAFANAITNISDDITAKVGSAAAVAVANSRITSTDNASYASSYNSGTWTGDINSNPVDITTGAILTTSLWTNGSASTQLDLRTPSSRYIVTSTDSNGDVAIGGVQFQPTTATTATKLSAAQQTLLNTSSTILDGANVLAYLRGARDGETSGIYRPRAHLLGDIINSEPVLVSSPSANYTDTGYSAFKTAYTSRTRMLYQAANDGMLHAFNAATGAEVWAYVPNLVIESLNNLSLKTGFTHKYYIDGTPVSADVDFKNIATDSSGGDWRTILVGGLGKGGRGFFALDVTNPNITSEAVAREKVLWEFPKSIKNLTKRNAALKDMGYSFGTPVIVKTKNYGWVILLTSGYNNGTNAGDSGGDGLGHLYVVNPKTGDLIADIETTACKPPVPPSTTPPSTQANPCGLAYITASVDSDNVVDYVYGGDLYGNVWRFDLTGSNGTVTKFTTLVDASGSYQPITTAPVISKAQGVRSISIGTGQYLGNSDIPGTSNANSAASQKQSVYIIRDDLSSFPSALRANLQQQTVTTTGTTRTLSNTAFSFPAKRGCFIDLETTGERIYNKPAVLDSSLVFTSNIPSSTKCQPGGSSWLYTINGSTCGLSSTSTSQSSGQFLGQSLASRPVVVQLPDGQNIALVRKSDGTSSSYTLPPSATVNMVRTWRQLNLY